MEQATRAGVHVEVLTDTGGVNLSPYLRAVVAGLKSHWQAGTGEVVLDLSIGADGQLTAMRLEGPVKDEAADKAAWSAAKETKFEALPVGVKGPLKLRVSFVGH